MGLGKTLTMIALAATDLDSGVNTYTADQSVDISLEDRLHIAATLIIIPPPRTSQRFGSRE